MDVPTFPTVKQGYLKILDTKKECLSINQEGLRSQWDFYLYYVDLTTVMLSLQVSLKAYHTAAALIVLKVKTKRDK